MSLSSLQLDAFFEVAQTGNFSKAAKNLHLTQPAFSQRILNLEKEMGVSLLIREPSGVRLTEAGHRLLAYCQTKQALEREALGGLREGDKTHLVGEIRIGAYSSVFRSVVMPALNGLVKQSSRLGVECFVREIPELPGLLKSCEAEFVIVDHKIKRPGIESHLLGHETYVLAEPEVANDRGHIYLDHDPDDRITEMFFERQGTSERRFERSFMSDIYGVIAGVESGWGRAVLPLHLIRKNGRLRIVETKKDLQVPVFLNYRTQPYYTVLHKKVVKALVSNCKDFL